MNLELILQSVQREVKIEEAHKRKEFVEVNEHMKKYISPFKFKIHKFAVILERSLLTVT
jgi:hypothetical protein